MKIYDLEKLLLEAGKKCRNYPDGAIYHDAVLLPPGADLNAECRKNFPAIELKQLSPISEIELKRIVKDFLEPPLGKDSDEVLYEFFGLINLGLNPYESFALEWDLSPGAHALILGFQGDANGLLLRLSWSRD